MDSKRLRRILIVFLVTIAPAIAFFLIYGDGTDGARLTVINQSRETVTELTAHLEEGTEYELGELADGGSVEVDLEDAEGESLVWISYTRPGGATVESNGEYIEDSDLYHVEMTIQPGGRVLIVNDLEYR